MDLGESVGEVTVGDCIDFSVDVQSSMSSNRASITVISIAKTSITAVIQRMATTSEGSDIFVDLYCLGRCFFVKNSVVQFF